MPKKKAPIIIALLISIIGVGYAHYLGQKEKSNPVAVAGELVTAPNDDLALVNASNTNDFLNFDFNKKTDPAVELSNSLTANVSRSLFSNYIYSKERNVPLDTDTADVIAGASLQTVSVSGKKIYRVSDFLIKESSNPSDILQYNVDIHNALKEILVQPEFGITNILTVIQTSVSTQNESELGKLGPIINEYEKTLGSLLKVQVPREALLVHFDLVNGLKAMIYDLKRVVQTFSDPVNALFGIDSYSKTSEDFRQAVVQANLFFGEKLGDQ